jgi:hypothetical protein
MRVELKDGGFAELRDKILGSDRLAAKAAIRLHVNEDGSREISGDLDDLVKLALLRRLIVDWSYGQPLPHQAHSAEQAQDILTGIDDEDLGALYEAVQPVYDRVLSNPKRKIISGSVLSDGSSADPEQPARLTRKSRPTSTSLNGGTGPQSR